jgi:hypothetical protein
MILKENYLKAAPVVASESQATALTEGFVNSDSESVTDGAGPMSVYMNALSRQLKKL